ncbi:MAG: trypsin-like peptidase domain-containing protein [Thermoproteota archaeon]|nr:trypsin-like peptidase domain-containing protein [Thermoproteota archaeon]
MRKPFVPTIAIIFTVFAITVIIIPVSTFTIPLTVMAAQQQDPINSTASTQQNANSSSSTTSLPLKTIFKQAEASVVQITSKIPAAAADPLNPQSNATTLGSGFVYDSQGHIITNGHVVGDAKIVDVTFIDGNRYTAKVIGTDIYSDIAVLQISQNNTQAQQLLSSIKPLALSNSSTLEVGDQVIAIGNPFGLSDTMTTGIVSGVGRLLPAASGIGFSIPNTIQTDAPINPGNSGGPLLNTQGQVIGMNTAIFSATGTFSGIGFAIPSNTIIRIAPALIEKGHYLHPYLGLNGATLTSDLSQNLTGGAAATNLKGIYIDTITKNGPADKAGVHGSTIDQYSKKHAGDVIIGVDGHNIVRIDDLISYIDQHKSVGDNITLTVYRNGHAIDLNATLTSRPSLIPFLTAPSIPPSPIPHPPARPAPLPHP